MWLWAAIAQLVQRFATGWTVRGSNPGGGQIFRTRSYRPWGPLSLLYNGYRLFPGVRASGAWRWPPTPIYSAEVKEGVQLCFYSTSRPSWPVIGWIYLILWNEGACLALRGLIRSASHQKCQRFAISTSGIDKRFRLFLYCRSGVSSGRANQFIRCPEQNIHNLILDIAC